MNVHTLHKQQMEPKMLKCVECDFKLPLPFHCGRHMEVQGTKLVCWKGEHKPCCNNSSIMDIPYHHEKPMTLIKF